MREKTMDEDEGRRGYMMGEGKMGHRGCRGGAGDRRWEKGVENPGKSTYKNRKTVPNTGHRPLCPYRETVEREIHTLHLALEIERPIYGPPYPTERLLD